MASDEQPASVVAAMHVAEGFLATVNAGDARAHAETLG
jgi:hypothetical protein